MAPKKTPPPSLNSVKLTRGITFSFGLQNSDKLSECTRVTQGSLCKSDYELQVAVHNVTSISLIKRMNFETDSLLRSRNESNAAEPKVTSKITKPGELKRKKAFTHTLQPGQCIWCLTTKTAQWRRGPPGPRSLCNRCGIEWAKQIKDEAKSKRKSLASAELYLKENYRQSERFKKFAKEHLNQAIEQRVQ